LFSVTRWTRDRQIMSLEQAHYKISGLSAWIATRPSS
jgi:hypothetical protein